MDENHNWIFSKTRFLRAASWMALILCIALAWMWSYQKWSMDSWCTPISNESDARALAATVTAYRNGDIQPFGSKIVERLGAPYQGNWNDFPASEDYMLAIVGYMARVMDTGVAMNLAVMLLFMLNGCAFYAATRILKYDRLISLALAFAYAFSAAAYHRNMTHITVLAYWIFPLLFALILRVATARMASRKIRYWLPLAIFGLLIGLSFVYYSWIAMQLVAIAVVVALIRRQKNPAVCLCILGGGIIAGVILGNLDTISYWIGHGTAKNIIMRPLFDGEREAIRMPSLFFPAEHRVQAVADWTQKHYYKADFPLGEDPSEYLGIIGIVSLAALCVFTLVNFWKKKPRPPHVFFWQALWVFLYSCAGGVNLVLFVAGFDFFRATNRYSILILTLVLLFLARLLSRVPLRRWRIPVAIALLCVAAFDQVRMQVTAQSIEESHAQIVAHRNFFESFEKAMPRGAMVFELPVCLFPEAPLPYAGKWRDYENMMPYVYTKTLRFSYGTDKGRGQEMWQFPIAQMPAAKMVERLSSCGFSAILIDRRFIEKNAAELVQNLQLVPGVEMLDFGHPYYVAFRLPKSDRVTTPAPYFKLSRGFGEWERGQGDILGAWAGQEAQMTITNFLDQPLEVSLLLNIVTVRDASITISANEKDTVIASKAFEYNSVTIKIMLKPGITPIVLNCSKSPVKMGDLTNDTSVTRMVSMSVWGPAVNILTQFSKIP